MDNKVRELQGDFWEDWQETCTQLKMSGHDLGKINLVVEDKKSLELAKKSKERHRRKRMEREVISL